LTSETALYYQDLCLNELVRVKDDEKHIYDENLLAAAIILRFYEEVDGEIRAIDSEVLAKLSQRPCSE
jgi:hypothetical protein